MISVTFSGHDLSKIGCIVRIFCKFCQEMSVADDVKVDTNVCAVFKDCRIVLQCVGQ